MSPENPRQIADRAAASADAAIQDAINRINSLIATGNEVDIARATATLAVATAERATAAAIREQTILLMR